METNPPRNSQPETHRSDEPGGDSWVAGGLISCDGAETAQPVVPPGTGTTKNQSDADGQGGTNWPIRARSAANWATKWAGFGLLR